MASLWTCSWVAVKGFRLSCQRVWGLRDRVPGLGFKVQGSGFKVQGLGTITENPLEKMRYGLI